jgi:hypothetical protein
VLTNGGYVMGPWQLGDDHYQIHHSARQTLFSDKRSSRSLRDQGASVISGVVKLTREPKDVSELGLPVKGHSIISVCESAWHSPTNARLPTDQWKRALRIRSVPGR